MLPSALIQLSLMLSTRAPAKPAAVVTLREATSLVVRVHVPSALRVPLLSVQSAGAPVTVSVTSPSLPVGSVRPRLIGSPAIPAGLRLVWVFEALVCPALSENAPASIRRSYFAPLLPVPLSTVKTYVFGDVKLPELATINAPEGAF